VVSVNVQRLESRVLLIALLHPDSASSVGPGRSEEEDEQEDGDGGDDDGHERRPHGCHGEPERTNRHLHSCLVCKRIAYKQIKIK
jgi:hypothetical protein